MKKSIFTLFAAAITLAACQKNEIQDPHLAKVLHARIEQIADTKTSMDKNNNILWSEGDQVVAFMKSTDGSRFQVTLSSVGNTSADFDDVSTEDGELHSGNELSHNVVYYPYSSDAKCKLCGDAYALSVVLPSKQTYAEDSFGNGSMAMAAVGETNNITFRNVLGGIKFQLLGTQKLTSITLQGKNNEKLSGAATVTAYPDGSKPTIVMSSDASETVMLNCGDGVQLKEDEATTFIIALPPVEFSRGFTATVTTVDGGIYSFTTDKSNEVKRSSLLVMPAVALDESTLASPKEGDYIDEYGINHGQGVEIDGIVWAPVNCGYHEADYPYGKLYQWGRRLGHGYSDETTIEIKEGGVSLLDGQSESNTNIFFLTGKNNGDWLYPSFNNLWNSGTGLAPEKTEYDPCPKGWRVPTFRELSGLRENTSALTTNAVGQRGYWFSGSSSYVTDIPQVFFPAAGRRLFYDGDAIDRGHFGYYWVSSSYYDSTDESYGAYSLSFYAEDVYMGAGTRVEGCSVRCVQDDSELVPVSSLTLNETSLTLNVDNISVLSATITPSNANHKEVFWRSEDEDIVMVDQNGKVKAISAGTTTIIAMAGMQSAACSVTVPIREGDYVDEYGISHGQGVEIDGVVWAPVNCGYHKTDYQYGKLYQWGRKYGQGYDGYDYNNYSDVSDATVPIMSEGGVALSDGQSESNSNVFFLGNSKNNDDWLYPSEDKLWNSGTEYNPIKTVYDPCPDGWRVPTCAEFEELIKNKSSMTTNDKNQRGYWFSGSTPYDSSVPQVFFLAAGYRYYRGQAGSRGLEGNYWSSRTLIGYGTYDVYSYYLSFSKDNVEVDDTFLAYGCSVRCVQE